MFLFQRKQIFKGLGLGLGIGSGRGCAAARQIRSKALCSWGRGGRWTGNGMSDHTLRGFAHDQALASEG